MDIDETPNFNPIKTLETKTFFENKKFNIFKNNKNSDKTLFINPSNNHYRFTTNDNIYVNNNDINLSNILNKISNREFFIHCRKCFMLIGSESNYIYNN